MCFRFVSARDGKDMVKNNLMYVTTPKKGDKELNTFFFTYKPCRLQHRNRPKIHETNCEEITCPFIFKQRKCG